MEQKQRFWTGLIAMGDEIDKRSLPIKGAGWSIQFERQRRKPASVHQGREVVLYAKNWRTAQRALDLIDGCHQLLSGNPWVFSIQFIAHNADELGWMNPKQRQELKQQTYCTGGFPLACSVAAKASCQRTWIYAIAKYRYSMSLFSVHSADLEPFRSPHLPVSSFPEDHLRFAHAIIAAYSAVEELGLEIRASAKNPSLIKGQWNPVVRQELESRLRKAGVDLAESILWTMRGTKRRTEKARPIPFQTKAPWSAWEVRDSDVHISDAIAYADWLRDCVASHTIKDLTLSLSPYDVINVQHLARRLVLESLHYWRN